MNFKEIIKNEQIIKALDEIGYVEPTDIQRMIMPLIEEGCDVLGQSQTGTGKTLAFLAPILETIRDNGKIQVVILAPTRELAIQIGKDLDTFSKYTNIKNAVVYGSSSIEAQIKDIRRGVEIVIGTPGRMMDLVRRHIVKVKNLKFFVLDEADEMLSMGFHEELETVLSETNEDKQMMMFSATMPQNVLRLASSYMKEDYKTVVIKSKSKTADNIEQIYYLVNDGSRLEALSRILDKLDSKRSMIFCRTKRQADEILERLATRGYSVDVIHGDVPQDMRIKTLDRFKKGLFNYLVATDVAARGIHVDDVEAVINYNIPESNEAYVHRIGRTGRAKKKGMSITLATPREEKIIRSIEKHVNSVIAKGTLPTKEDIYEIRKNQIISKISDASYKSESNLFSCFLDTLDNKQLKNILESLLEKELNASLGSDFNAEIKVTNKKSGSKKKDDGTSTRVFMTIGKMDHIEKRELLTFIEKTASIKEGTCYNVEIMPKFTFMNINNADVDKVIKNLYNKKFKGRTIKIEKAKK